MVHSIEPYQRDGPSSVELILRHSNDRPGSLALKDDNVSLTYGELAEQVAAVASGLATLGVEPGNRVALSMPNSAEFIVATLGCLWLGASFVPLSLDDPTARLARTIEDCDPALLVTRSDADPSVDAMTSQGRPVIDMETILASADRAPEAATEPDRDAYLIYTSGTTGVPKGIRTPERAFRWAILSAAQIVDLDRTTRTLGVSAFHFDGSFGTAFPTLVAGGALIIPKREDLLFLKRFFSAVLEEGITNTGFSPSYLRLLLSSPLLATLSRSNLGTLGLGGEECVPADLARLWEVLPNLRVFNRYGPTETTIQVTTHEIRRQDLASGTVPIGLPHPGVSFHIVAEDGRIVSEAYEEGELYIGGNQLMRGYWRDEELTSSVLRDDVVPSATVYRTGDRVCRDSRGRLLFVGRTDGVVKRTGVRVSLGEVARALRCVDHVSGAICLPTDLGGRLAITAFVEAGPEVTVPELMEAARAQLPATMLPDEVFLVRTLPLASSGKVDGGRLLADAARERWIPASPGLA